MGSFLFFPPSFYMFQANHQSRRFRPCVVAQMYPPAQGITRPQHETTIRPRRFGEVFLKYAGEPLE